jgi:hypothetical protein
VNDLFRCLNCNEVTSITYDRCKYCSIPIDRFAAQRALADFSHLNRACSIANGFRGSNYAFLALFIGGTAWWGVTGFLPAASLPVATQIIPAVMLISAVAWFFKYNTLQVRDPEYPEAKSTMKFSVQLWSVAILAQVLLWAYLIIRLISSFRRK